MGKELPLEAEAFYVHCCVQLCLNKFYQELPISIRLRAISRGDMKAACLYFALVFRLFRRKKVYGECLLQMMEKALLETFADLQFCASSEMDDASDPIWEFQEAIYKEMDRRENKGELYKKLWAEIGLRNFYKECLHQPMSGDENVEYIQLPF